MRFTGIDIIGLLLNLVINAGLMCLLPTLFDFDFLAKGQPSTLKPSVYIVPFAVGVFAGIGSSAFACYFERDAKSIPGFDSWRRLFTHLGVGLLAAIALSISFCCVWGDWGVKTSRSLQGYSSRR